jgi:hypothetical protein
VLLVSGIWSTLAFLTKPTIASYTGAIYSSWRRGRPDK